MALRAIVKIGEPILSTVAREVDVITPRVLQLIDDMVETMRSVDGVGLAAPQVGVRKRIVVIDAGEGVVEMINPVILSKDGEQTDLEGCLSVPDRHYNVTRPDKVTVRYLNRDGQEITADAEHLFARAVCHEVDHLEGVLFLAHVSEEEMRRQDEENEKSKGE